MEKSFIIDSIQSVLNKVFTSPNRRRLNLHHDRLNFCCFYCGDSKNEHKKRGNLYFNKLSYICFNCGKRTNLEWIIKEQGISVTPEQKIELIEISKKNSEVKKYHENIYETRLNDLISLNKLTDFFSDNLKQITNFSAIVKGGKQYDYLIGRGVKDELHKDIYQGRYWDKNKKYYDDCIILLNRRGDSLLGMQIRNIKEGDRRVFKILNYEMLYRIINQLNDDVELDIDENKLVLYNKLSYFFNILNIDFEDKITIFEGYLDSLFFPNSIGVVGTNTDFSFLENNELDLQYFFDNDSAGHKLSENKLRSGYNVFLWNKMFDWIIANKKTDDPYKLKLRMSKVKDLNALAILVDNPYKKLNLQNFMSKDLMDLIWIPKLKYNKKVNI